MEGVSRLYHPAGWLTEPLRVVGVPGRLHQCVCLYGYTRQLVGCDFGLEWHLSVGVSTDMHEEHGNSHLALMQCYAMATNTSPSLEEGGPSAGD